MTEALLFGRPLPEGGTIGVAAPASGFENRSEVLRGIEWWEAHGYRVKLGEHLFARDDYLAGDERDRATDLMALFADPEVDVVQALQGGYGSAQTIPHLDFEVIAQNPKPFVGYSDITALHAAFTRRSDVVTYHGPTARAVLSPFSRDSLACALVNGGDSCGAATDARVLRGGSAHGVLAGGNLALLSALAVAD